MLKVSRPLQNRILYKLKKHENPPKPKKGILHKIIRKEKNLSEPKSDIGNLFVLYIERTLSYQDNIINFNNVKLEKKKET